MRRFSLSHSVPPASPVAGHLHNPQIRKKKGEFEKGRSEATYVFEMVLGSNFNTFDFIITCSTLQHNLLMLALYQGDIEWKNCK